MSFDPKFSLPDCAKTNFYFQDKPALFRTFFKWLKPGGKVLISDYCKSAKAPSLEFEEYIKQRGYDLHDVQEYGQVHLRNNIPLLIASLLCFPKREEKELF